MILHVHANHMTACMQHPCPLCALPKSLPQKDAETTQPTQLNSTTTTPSQENYERHRQQSRILPALPTTTTPKIFPHSRIPESATTSNILQSIASQLNFASRSLAVGGTFPSNLSFHSAHICKSKSLRLMSQHPDLSLQFVPTTDLRDIDNLIVPGRIELDKTLFGKSRPLPATKSRRA
jgi:hypothetical protein